MPPDAARRVTEHIDRCARCRVVVAAAAPVLPVAAGELAGGDELGIGGRVGRFVVLGLLGRGGMGAVYAAYDADLGRKVAVKLVRPELGGDPLQTRLLREAQALARLSHPHVVTVYEVGRIGDDVFIAMELLEGGTLRQWLSRERRSWREIVTYFCRAGEGLAAAHAVGLVHRDFKPDNVLLGRDGQVRVTDFGLARASAADDVVAGEELPPQSPLAVSFTRSGAILGTPAFMAPEQMSGEEADPRADQFSFCAALYQALYGELPFAGEQLGEYRAAVLAQRIRAPSSRTRVPARLRALLLRGLRARRDERHASMRELLDALAGCLRHRLLLPLLAGAMVLLAVGAVGQAWVTRQQLVCSGAERKWAGIWDAARKQQTQMAFTRSGAASAASAWAATAEALDQYMHDWVAAHVEACEATQLRHEQPESVLALRYGCLGERLDEAHALIDLLGNADASVVARASGAAHGLSSFAACSDIRGLTTRLALPRNPAQAARVDELKKRLATVKALADLDQHEMELESARRVLADAQQAQYAPVEAEAGYWLARAQRLLGKAKEAEATLQAAALAALAGHDDRWLTASWNELSAVVGLDQHRRPEGWMWHRYAEIADARRGASPDAFSLPLLNDEAVMLQAEGKLDEAESVYRRVEAIQRQLPHHEMDALLAQDNIATILAGKGQLDEALPIFQRVLAAHEKALGKNHPDSISARENVAEALILLRRYAEALPLQEEVLRDRQTLQGERDPDTALSMTTLSRALAGVGRVAEADHLNRQGLALLEAAAGPDGPGLHEVVCFAGEDALALGRPAEAVTLLERALAMAARRQVSAYETAEVQFALARALTAARRDPERARALATTAREAYAATAEKYGGISSARAAEITSWLDALRR